MNGTSLGSILISNQVWSLIEIEWRQDLFVGVQSTSFDFGPIDEENWQATVPNDLSVVIDQLISWAE
jgi:hypothetical protein